MQEQGQRDAGPKPGDYGTLGQEAVDTSWGRRRASTAGKSPKDTEWFILPGGKQKTRTLSPTPVALLAHRGEKGGKCGSSLCIYIKNCPTVKPHRKGWMSFREQGWDARRRICKNIRRRKRKEGNQGMTWERPMLHSQKKKKERFLVISWLTVISS